MEAVEKPKRSSAQEYVDCLLTEGVKVSCDNLSEEFRNHDDLPPYYDEELFKKAQKFFHKHMFAFFFCKYLGLIAVLSVPSILKVLMFTRMSSSDMTAYRRYLATVFHIMVWYESDFKPGSDLWKSMAEVRKLHNSASNRSCSAGLHRITQKDMALTQFGFVGTSLIRSKMMGIHQATDEDWRAFVHLWRVIGYLLGIEERFNLCSGTVEEVRERCEILITQVFRPYVEQKDKDFLNMSRYIVNGLWSMNLFIKFESLISYLHILSLDEDNRRKLHSPCYTLNPKQQSNLRFLARIMYLLQYTIFRIYQNYMHILTLWLMKYFPFLSIYQFGRTNARVRILVNNKND